jgi:hypothetical protein
MFSAPPVLPYVVLSKSSVKIAATVKVDIRKSPLARGGFSSTGVSRAEFLHNDDKSSALARCVGWCFVIGNGCEG